MTTWRPLAACLLCGAIVGWTAQGWRKDASIATLQRVAATSETTAATQLAQATARVLTLERAADTALAQRADHRYQEQTHAKTERDRFNDDVRSGAVRLSIPIASGQCAATADSTAAASDQHQTRAELDPATAAALDAIAGDGDDATRQLNASSTPTTPCETPTMYKPNSLRQHLATAIPDLQRAPDRLQVFADEGNVVASATASLSFEYRFKLNLIVTDYAGDADAIMVALIAWLKVHQLDLMANEETHKHGIAFEVDFNNHETVDISIKQDLTERVAVKTSEAGRLDIKHLAEIQHMPAYADELWKLYAGEKLLAEWRTPEAAP